MPSNVSLEHNQLVRLSYGLAALSQGDRLVPWEFERRELRPNDIAIKIQFCGVCHSDLHAVRGNSRFPLERAEVHYRLVIDMSTLNRPAKNAA